MVAVGIQNVTFKNWGDEDFNLTWTVEIEHIGDRELYQKDEGVVEMTHTVQRSHWSGVQQSVYLSDGEA